MFTEEQLKNLEAPLNGKRVKRREQGNITLSYLEGYDIIDHANKIFGFDGWGYDVTKLEQVSEEINEKNNKVVAYRALITVTVYGTNHQLFVIRTDVGYGIGIAKDYASAHESGGKEAVTDSLKRTLRTFGSQFGNALYDKSQKNVDYSNNNQTSPQSQQASNVQKQANTSSYDEFQALGLGITEQNGETIVTGQTYGKQQTIKKYGFRWDAGRKVWYKSSQQVA
jgi:DNA repair and recombination protein RAD52